MSLINYLETIDQKIILLLNGNNILFLDKIMWMVTQPVFGLPFYILFIYLFFTKYNFKNALKIILVIGFAVGLGDFIAHELIKETFQRYRPSHHIQIANQLNYFLMSNGTFYIGGKFGFVSNHATNMSIVGVLVYLFLKKHYPKSWIYLSILVLIISYSRIYLGVHYLSDIIGGWMLGIILSISIFQLSKITILKI